MDDERVGDATDKLKRLQSNIASLFEDLRTERDQYKFEKDRLAHCVEAQLSEMKNLKREIEILQNASTGPSFSCKNCTELREKLIHQDKRLMELEKHLEEFLTVKSNYKACLMSNEQKTEETSRSGSGDHACERSANVTQSILQNQGVNDESVNNKVYNITKVQESYFEGILKRGSNKNVLNVSNVFDEESLINYDDSPGADKTTDVSAETGPSEQLRKEFVTPKKVDKKETGSVNTSHVNNWSGGRSPILLREQRCVLDRFLLTSPPPSSLKRNAFEDSTSSPSKMLFKSPKHKNFKSPVKRPKLKNSSHFKLTNAIEAEFSNSGIRKLKQAQLNIHYYKSKPQESTGDCDSLNTVDDKIAEDDLIMPSPTASSKGYAYDYRNEPKRSLDLEEGEVTPVKENGVPPDIDLDETYVSASFLENRCDKQIVSKSTTEENILPVTRERSPEYDPVHFPPCKGSPVRKKVKRMQLPGHMCHECNKYYSAILDEIDPKKLQEILNRCSRHRERECDVVDTPPGYWKPYLSATIDSVVYND